MILFSLLFLIERVLIFYSTEDKDNYGFTTEFKKKYIRYNKYGYRDYEYNLKKKEGVFRIIVLGDSQTFGHGIKDLNNTWVKKLEKKLIESVGNTSIEVLSISGPGWNSDTYLYELFKKSFKFNPDLVILAYYHNDIPFPISLNCDSSDRKITPDINIFQRSKLVSFINFRINRLLEKIGKKPRYSDCLNQAYDSIGWEMNKFYLDIMGLSLSIKKIHFMITVIPLIHQLDSNYPLAGPHKKLKEFSIKRNIEFLDFYEEGFKNLNPSNLKVSKTDHHLNKNAGDIMADVLFEKIKGLIKYKNLSYFNKAFTLKEILNENPLLIKLDSLFNKLNSINTFILNSETKGLQVTRSSTQLIIKKLQKEKNVSNPISLTETKLSLSGDYIYHEKVTFHPNSKLPNLKESILNKSGVFIKTIEQIQPDTKVGLVALKLGQREFQFDFEGDENHKRIKLEKDITFPDPKVLDKWIFLNNHSPSEEYSRKELIQKLIDMTIKNPSIYYTSDDIKIINQADYFENLSNEIISQMYDERILFQTFLIFGRYGAKEYVNLLIELIDKSKPSLMSVNAADRYR
ncbi:MAG: SGNH/GDSL hydrolase family protein, partial [Flavobacteriaceae bacterium]|nr:SGNH/GDSL hydrolase family protein [Flavobacteriaceae bacterium]